MAISKAQHSGKKYELRVSSMNRRALEHVGH